MSLRIHWHSESLARTLAGTGPHWQWRPRGSAGGTAGRPQAKSTPEARSLTYTVLQWHARQRAGLTRSAVTHSRLAGGLTITIITIIMIIGTVR